MALHVCPKPNCNVRGLKDELYIEFFSKPKAAILACDNKGVMPCTLLYHPLEMFQCGVTKTAATLNHNARERHRQQCYAQLFAERSKVEEDGRIDELWHLRELSFLLRNEKAPRIKEARNVSPQKGIPTTEKMQSDPFTFNVKRPFMEDTDQIMPERPMTVPTPPELPQCLPRTFSKIPLREKMLGDMIQRETDNLNASLRDLKQYGEVLGKRPQKPTTSPGKRGRLWARRKTSIAAGDLVAEEQRRETRATIRTTMKTLKESIESVARNKDIDNRVEAARLRKTITTEEYRKARQETVSINNMQKAMETFVTNAAHASAATERRGFLKEIETAVRELDQDESETRESNARRAKFQHALKEKLLRLVKQCEHENKSDSMKQMGDIDERYQALLIEKKDMQLMDRLREIAVGRVDKSIANHDSSESRKQHAMNKIHEMRTQWHNHVEAMTKLTDSRTEKAKKELSLKRNQMKILAEIRDVRMAIAKEKRESQHRARQLKEAREEAQHHLKAKRVESVHAQKARAAQDAQLLHEQQRVMRTVVGQYLEKQLTTKQFKVPEEFQLAL